MVFEKSKRERLSEELFKNPTSEFRGAPFWAWNDELSEQECLWQAHIFQEMGFGGYHMHPRAGLATPYLGEKFMSCVKACVEDAKKNGMLAWLYDEDRYPSGFAGGAVTKDGRFRRRGLIFTSKKRAEDATYLDGRQCGGSKLLATYAVRLCFGKCMGYTRLDKGDKGRGRRFYAYLVVDEPTDSFNCCGYIDSLYKEALDAFADYTYGAYKAAVGEEFGKTVPAIFTDEPQTKFIAPFKFSICPTQATIPWTDDFAKTYQEQFGADILDYLPELFFDVDTPSLYRTRFTYHTHRVERFAQAFSDNLGKRAEELGIHLTGHLMEEPTLKSQSRAVGETMRHYKNFGLPGIDMLCGRHEYTTAKQTQSVVRQEGKEGMLCECYGVSRWVVEFGKFKEEGDWLACLGVTVRVPHLSFYSMRGEAKRDYPPSIFYQAPWYKKFKAVEDHFARLDTVMTRGKAINDVAVIHPIESYFLHIGPDSDATCEDLDKKFLSLTEWLLFNNCDFDFIAESLLPSQRTSDPLSVGNCAYKTILVPSLLTMRQTTLDYLKGFAAAGGKVVFLGRVPSMVEGIASSEVERFAKESGVIIPFDEKQVVAAIGEREFTVSSVKKPQGYLATLRQDGSDRWLFLTSPRPGFPYPRSVLVTNEKTVVRDFVRVGVKGEWRVTEYNTLTGEVRPLPAEVKKGVTYVCKTLYNNDSLLLRYEKADGASFVEEEESVITRTFALADGVRYELHEPNALLLDKAKWSVGGSFHARCDVDLISKKTRKALGLPAYRPDLQPWLHAGEEVEKFPVTLRFEVESKQDFAAHLACEYNTFTLVVNGEEVKAKPDGYYVDKVIRTTPISLKKGKNVIDLTFPMGKYDSCENCYLLGEFGVLLKGTKACLVSLPEKLFFRDVTNQYLPFYSGKITYYSNFTTQGEKVEISTQYDSAMVTVRVNDEEKDILFAPYSAVFNTKKGENALAISAYVSRQNAFGAVHIRKPYKRSDSPSWFHKTMLPWRVKGYVMDPGGVIAPPVISVLKEQE